MNLIQNNDACLPDVTASHFLP